MLKMPKPNEINKTEDSVKKKESIKLEKEIEKDVENKGNEEKKSENVNDNDFLELKDKLLRTLAENENLRKRTSKDIEQTKKYGHIYFVRDLLSSVDNLSRAVTAVPIEKEKLDEPIKNLIIGVEIVLNEINSFLEKNHIKKIDPKGEKFDYNFHQAMYETNSDKFEPGTVVEVVQCGYLLHDRLVRPAMVGISKKTVDKKINDGVDDQDIDNGKTEK